MDRIEEYFGATPEMLERAARAAISGLLGGAIERASTEDGATTLLSQLNHPVAVTPGDMRAAIRQGEPIAASLLGPRLAGAADVVRSSSNVSPSAATGVLALAAPMVMSVLGHVHAADAGEFGTILAGQRGHVLAAGPAAVTAVVEDGGFTWRHILPMVLLGTVLVAVPFLYKGCSEAPIPAVPITKAAPPVAEVRPEKIALPNGGEISVLAGTINYELSKFLAGADPAPKRFTFDHLNFESNKTVITPESRPTLTDLATILKSYPAVDVSLEGYTDSVGTPAENKKLSLDRASAIKTELQGTGIAAKRITAAGYGEEKPVASNETDEGRAKNRRLELVVLKK